MATPATGVNRKPGSSSTRHLSGTNSDQVTELSTSPASSKIIEFLNDNTRKKKLNSYANGTAAAINFFTFLNGNFNFFDTLQDKLEFLSNASTKIATATQGFVGSIDTLCKNNVVPLIGHALEIPIAALSSGFNLWLFRGISQGTSQFQAIIKRREIKIKDKNQQEIILSKEDGDNFKKYGLSKLEGVKITFGEIHKLIKEIPQLFKDLFKKNFKGDQTFSRSLFTSSITQIFGALLALAGLTKIGAGIRDFAGSCVDFALMTDNIKQKPENNNTEPVKNGKKKSYFVIGGTVWMLAAIVDFFKRFSFFSDRINSLTQLSLFSDRFASIFYCLGNLTGQDEENQPHQALS